MAVALLCTKVQAPNEDNYRKLARVMQYLCCMNEMTLTIEPGINAQWWVENSYGVHPDMHSQSGIVITLEKL